MIYVYMLQMIFFPKVRWDKIDLRGLLQNNEKSMHTLVKIYMQ